MSSYKFVLLHCVTNNNNFSEVACIEYKNILQIDRTFQSSLNRNSNDDARGNKAQTLNSILDNTVWIVYDQNLTMSTLQNWFTEYNYSFPTPLQILDVSQKFFNNKSLSTIFDEYNISENNFNLFQRNRALSECHMIYECLVRQSLYGQLTHQVNTSYQNELNNQQLQEQPSNYSNTINTNTINSNNVNDDYKSLESYNDNTSNNNINNMNINNMNNMNNTSNINNINSDNVDDNNNRNDDNNYSTQEIDEEPELEPRSIINNDNTINNSNINTSNQHSKSTNTTYMNNNNRPTKPPQPQQINTISYKSNISINQDVNNESIEQNISNENDEEDENHSSNEKEDNNNNNSNNNGSNSNVDEIPMMDNYNPINNDDNFNNNNNNNNNSNNNSNNNNNNNNNSSNDNLRYQNGNNNGINDNNSNNNTNNNSRSDLTNNQSSQIQSIKQPSSWAKRVNTEKAPGSPQKKRLTIKNVSQDSRPSVPRPPDPRNLPRVNTRNFKTKELNLIKRYINDAMTGYKPVWISYRGGRYPLVPRGIHPTRWDRSIQGGRLAFFGIPYRSQSGKEAKFYIDLVFEVRSKKWIADNQQQTYRNQRGGDNRRNPRIRSNYNNGNNDQLGGTRYNNNRNSYSSNNTYNNSRRQQNIRS